MIDNFAFYLKHSFNDLRVNRQRTVFALLCIAAGVAAIVSLQTLAVMIQSSLTGGLQESNRGDIQIQSGSTFMARGDTETVAQAAEQGLLIKSTQSFFGQQQDSYQISLAGVDAIRAWFEQNYPGQAEITYRQPLAEMTSLIFGGGEAHVAGVERQRVGRRRRSTRS